MQASAVEEGARGSCETLQPNFFTYFSRWVSVKRDKAVTVSLQTEAQGAHLKQWDDWPTAIASQHVRETGEVVEVGESKERRIKNLAHFHSNWGTRQTYLWQSRRNCFASRQGSLCCQSRGRKKRWLMELSSEWWWIWMRGSFSIY